MKVITLTRRACGLGVALALLVSACLRIDEPDSFHCESDGDCLEGEKCGVQGICLLDGECKLHEDCESSERSGRGRCVRAECRSIDDPACGSFQCNTLERLCVDVCSDDLGWQSQSLCDAGVCRPSAQLADGVECALARDCRSKSCCKVANRSMCSSGPC